MTILVSPAERHPALANLGISAQVTETYGADFMVAGPAGLAGIQRKALPDLIASIKDGRLQREVAQMKPLPGKYLVVEGFEQAAWSVDGVLLTDRSRRPVTRQMVRSMLLSVRNEQVHVDHTRNEQDTAEWIAGFSRWWAKSDHRALKTRPTPRNAWGTVSDRDWAVHLLQSFPGIGATVATAIVDKFGGVPMAWTVTVDDLCQVDGIGKVRATRLIDALQTVTEPAA